MQQVLEYMFAAADTHGQDTGEPDHTVGDLQDLFRLAWGIMSIGQRLQLLRKPETQDIIEAGSRDEFTGESLAAGVMQRVAKMESVVVAAGIAMMEGERGFFWETPVEASEDFHDRADAVADAYRRLTGIFSKHTGNRALEETSIEDIQLSEQEAFWRLLGEEGDMSEEDMNRLYAAWRAAQES